MRAERVPETVQLPSNRLDVRARRVAAILGILREPGPDQDFLTSEANGSLDRRYRLYRDRASTGRWKVGWRDNRVHRTEDYSMRRLLDLLSPIPFPAWFMRVGGRLNAAWLRRTKGRGPLTSNVLVLTTRGRRTGRARSTALLHFDHEDRRYIVASFAGADQPPAWYLNLIADPKVSTELAGTLTHCIAHVLDDDQAAAVWPHLDEGYHGFSRYRRRTSRRLPIVELLPEQAAGL